MRRLIGLLVLIVAVQGQEVERNVLYGLPPLPDDPTTTHPPPPSVRPRIFRFGPLIHPVIHHPPIPPPALPHHHPLHLPFPQLGNPFDNYHNINPIPELPPRPENKLNGFYDLDGNFVPYGNEEHLPSQSSGRSRPKRAPMTEEDLRLRLLEEEYAYDDELSEPKIQNVGTTRVPSKSAAKNAQQLKRARQMVSHDTENPNASNSHSVLPKRPSRKGVINHNPTTTKKPSNVHPRYLPHPPTAKRPAQKPRQVLTPAYQNQQQVQPAYYPVNQVNQPYSQAPQNAPQYARQYHQYQPLPAPVQFAAPNSQRPVVAENRDPQVVAYLKDIEDYDWDFKGDRPDLVKLAGQEGKGTTPETLVPLNGKGDRTLIATTVSPYSPATFPAARYGPAASTSLPAAGGLQSHPAFTPAPQHDLLGLFGGTPHPILSGFGQLFSGFQGLGGGR